MVIFVFCIGLEMLLVVLDIIIRLIEAVREFFNKKNVGKKSKFFEANWIRDNLQIYKAKPKHNNNVF